MKSLNYQITSQEQNRPYLVLIHGLFGDADNLSAVRREFESSHNVLSVDLPDHGQSPQTDQFSFERCASMLIATMDELSINQATLLGHSLGGKVAMTVALTSPSRVSGLIAADIAPVEYAPRHQNVFKALNAVPLERLESRTQALQFMQPFLPEPGVAQFLLKSLHQQDQQWRWRFNLVLLQRDYAILSGAISADHPYKGPVLFIKGGNSDYILPQHKEQIMALFPHSEAKIIGAAGHWLHAEKPQLFNRIVKQFLTDKSRV